MLRVLTGVSTETSTNNDVSSAEFGFASYERHRMRVCLQFGVERARPFCRQTCFVTEVFFLKKKCSRNHPDSFQFVPPGAVQLREYFLFWPIDPGIVIGTHNNVPVPTSATTWRARKGVLEVMTGRTWPDPGLCHKAGNMGVYALLRFWQDYVADKFGRREAILPNTLALPKSVFSYAVTVMNKVEGWNDANLVGSKFAACMWIVLCDGQGPTQENLRRTLSTILESVSWVRMPRGTTSG